MGGMKAALLSFVFASNLSFHRPCALDTVEHIIIIPHCTLRSPRSIVRGLGLLLEERFLLCVEATMTYVNIYHLQKTNASQSKLCVSGSSTFSRPLDANSHLTVTLHDTSRCRVKLSVGEGTPIFSKWN